MLSKVKKAANSGTMLLIVSLSLGIVFGRLFRFFPENITTATVEYIVSPLMSIILGLFSALMVPYVFVEITNAICAQSGKGHVGRLVGKMLVRFVVIVFSITLLSALISMFFFKPSGSLKEAFDPNVIVEQIKAIAPTSVFQPFVEGNILQIVVISAFLGICLLMLGDRVNGIVRLISQCRILAEKMFSILAKTVPVVAFLSFFKVTATSSFEAIRMIWKVVPASLLTDFIAALIFSCTVCFRRKLSFSRIVRQFKEPLIKAFASGTSSVVIQDVIDISEDNGVDGTLVRLHAPMAFVFLSTGYSILYVCSVFWMAEVTGVTITAQKLILIILLVFQFTISTPRVSGGCLTVFTVLLTQLAIPTDGAAIILVPSVLLSNITTGIAVFIKILDELDLACSMKAVKGDSFI